MVLAFQDLLRDGQLITRAVPEGLALCRVVAQRLPLDPGERGERGERRRAADQAQTGPQLDSTRSTYGSLGGTPSAIARSNRARPM